MLDGQLRRMLELIDREAGNLDLLGSGLSENAMVSAALRNKGFLYSAKPNKDTYEARRVKHSSHLNF